MIHRFSFAAALFLLVLAGVSAGMANLTHPLNKDFRRMSLIMSGLLLIGAGLLLILSEVKI